MDDWLKDFEEMFPEHYNLSKKNKSRSKKVAYFQQISTSEDDPLRVDWIDEATIDYVGGLGITILPGRKDSGMGLFRYKRDLIQDIRQLKQDGVNTLVSLVEGEEIKWAVKTRAVEFFNQIRKVGINPVWYPIIDMHAPHPKNIRPVIQQLVQQIRSGKKVVVHCRGGLGRAGTVVGAILIEMGYDPDFSVDAVRGARPGAIQTQSQEKFLDKYWDLCCK